MEAGTFSGAPRLARARRWQELSLAALAAVAAGGVVAVTGDWRVAGALGASAGLFVAGLLAPAAFVTALLVARPLVDWMSETKLAGGANAAGLLALLVIGILVVHLSARRPRVIHPPYLVNAFAVGLGVSALAAVLAGVNYGEALGSAPVAELARLGALFSMYLLGCHFFQSLDRVRALFAVVALSAVIPALVGIYQWIVGITPNAELGFGRLNSTFVDSSGAGSYLAMAAVILIALPRNSLRWSLRLGALAPVLIALVGTYSRTGWIILAVGVVLLGLRERKAMVMAGAVAIALALASIPSLTEERVLRTETLSVRESDSVLPASVRWRVDNWKGLLGKYGQSPIVGYGLKTARVVNPTFAGREHRQTATPENPTGRVGADSHSSAVRALVEGGPLLLAAWVAIFVALIGSMRRLGRGSSEMRSYARLLAVLWIAMAVVGLVSGDVLSHTAVLFALLALSGAVVGALQATTAAERRGASEQAGVTTAP